MEGFLFNQTVPLVGTIKNESVVYSRKIGGHFCLFFIYSDITPKDYNKSVMELYLL